MRGCNFQVIVKFIRKAKILVDCWVEDAILGSIPLEISLLAKFKHPNIVKVKYTYVLVPSSWKSAHLYILCNSVLSTELIT